MARVTPYAYVASGSPVHALGAGPKLASLFVFSFIALSGGAAGLSASAAFVFLGAAFARLRPMRLLAGSSALVWTTLAVVALRALDVSAFARSGGDLARIIDREGLGEGLLFSGGVLVAFAAGSLLFATTTMTELRGAVARGQRAVTEPLARLLRAPGFLALRRAARTIENFDLSLVIALTLGFMPRVFDAWEAAADARKARCGSTGVFGTAAMIPLVAERLMDLAAETATALEARGYDYQVKK